MTHWSSDVTGITARGTVPRFYPIRAPWPCPIHWIFSVSRINVFASAKNSTVSFWHREVKLMVVVSLTLRSQSQPCHWHCGVCLNRVIDTAESKMFSVIFQRFSFRCQWHRGVRNSNVRYGCLREIEATFESALACQSGILRPIYCTTCWMFLWKPFHCISSLNCFASCFENLKWNNRCSCETPNPETSNRWNCMSKLKGQCHEKSC